MGKKCIVPGCITGSPADVKRRQIDQVRKCALFKAPMILPLRKLWEDELGIKLKTNQRVCELHFKHEDLNMSDDYTLINGEIIVSARERITLKKNAVPVKNIVKAKHRVQENKNEHRLSNVRQYGKSTQTAKRKPEFIDVSTDVAEVRDNLVLQDVEMEEIETFDPYADTDENSRDDVDYSGDKEITNNNCQSTKNELSIDESVFGLMDLVEILEKSPLRRNWTWGEKDGDIVFTLLDYNTLTVRCYLQVHTDMSVTTLLSDKEKLVNFTGIVVIESFEDLVEILKRLENQKLCLGTGLPEKSRSDSCAISTKTSSVCSFCLKEKTKLEKNKLSTEERYNDSFKNNILLKKKSSYYSKKLDEARKRIKELEEEVINLENNYVNKILGKLTDVQREIVSMFLKFSGLEKNRMRYSRGWACECLFMRRKSCALYEYMRKRGILPLPSSGTLQDLLDTINKTDLETNNDNLDSDTHETNVRSLPDSSAFNPNSSEQM